MKVYTFSTGGCRDGIYMDRFSSSIDGISRLIQDNWFEYGKSSRIFDRMEVVDESITVYYIEYGDMYKEEFDLIVIDVC